ncbi:MAG: alpha-hydroxy-acid oxidizing protein [Bryobacterales bacterium]|nr:alpha-hydroxy-acid oxidizing protein [Bryobacterales bacterium]MBV9401022.1 alpha-hydroxy-acid oxidizing protein [Bryobacterales bacterium]
MNDSRRRFLRYLAASPLLAHVRAQGPPVTLSSAKDALSVMDFEEPAHKALPPAHWGYMASGVDDDLTLKTNMAAFKRIQLRPRRLVDVSKTDLSIELFGTTWESPIFLCPVGGQKMFHPEGEIAVARAARAKKSIQILSTVTTSSVEDVGKALGRPPWYQLYMPTTWDATEKMVRRVEECGCQALAWTVDLLGGRNTETAERFRRQDTRNCLDCHTNNRGGRPDAALPMFAGLAQTFNPPAATWEYFDRLRKLTKMKLLLKGLDNREDARLAREHGADGIIVSNHGGRAAETLRATIECLPEVVDAAGGQIPVLVDGGFRRGTDVYKALALGARAVGIGRPYIYGLTAFGQEGVEQVLDILRAELTLTMRQCGTPAVKEISRAAVIMGEARL